MNDLHNADIGAWAMQQAELLRRRAAGELANDVELDWLNIAEEIAKHATSTSIRPTPAAG